MVLATVLSIPFFAHADYGYICEVQQYNYSGFGPDGGVQLTFYSQPNCSGSYLYTGYLCTGGTSTVCTNDSYHNNFSEAQLQSHYDAAIEAASNGDKVRFYFSSSCKSGGSSCLDVVYFGGRI